MSGPWLADRVKQTSTTTGTGTLSLDGTVPTGFRGFVAGVGDTNTCYYAIVHRTLDEWECGIGTVTDAATDTLSRTAVLSSSTGSAVSFSAGTKDVFVTQPAAAMGPWLPEIAVTGAVTATIDRRHYCTGTSADYTVTLPAASGNAGRRLWFRMAPIASLSKLVTLDGNASETIDGATTRIMWSGESCELLCDGSSWFKIGGHSHPMTCTMIRDTTTSVNTATVTAAPLNATLTDNTGRMANTGSTRIDIKRPSVYVLFPKVSGNGTGVNNVQARVHKNGSLLDLFAAYLDSNGSLTGPLSYTLAAGDYLELYAYQTSGGTRTLYGAAGDTATSLFVEERIQW